ncbi:hypothetical protein HY29_07355 [Hyphomonas beringensis]|uniref:Glutathione S-transferase n=1 Tax=Hyphomonas beringensis TaxID=1280946 RepID=A0A062TYK5_9PROT|nr:MAPEG family protein [Hyphomonas beringensis]KCZ50573.1 hypothetical protein HY29_07355 [Hyphomonas beringensis]
MTAMAAATLYVGLFALLMLVLKANVARVRAKEKVMFGDGDNDAMLRAIRVQGNAVEDVPIVLIGLVALGAMAAPVWAVHGLGAAFLLGRVLHAVGLGGSSGSSMGRMVGTLLSAVVLLLTAGLCVGMAVAQVF